MPVLADQPNLSKSFSQSAMEVLNFLYQTINFDLWVVTRHNDGDYIVLKSKDHGYNLHPGDTFKWCDTFCSRMVKGEGPNFAPNLADFTSYVETPFASIAKVGSYMGVPIRTADGEVFGTLCAVDPDPKDPGLRQFLPMVETFATLLGNMVDGELKATAESRRAERAEAEAMMDTITPLYNRRGWDLLTHAEEKRAKEYGHHLCVISIDLDNLKKLNDTYGHAKGSEYITNAGKAIKNCITESDIASRTGGDEYNILLVDCDDIRAAKIADNIRRAFKDVNVEGSLGIAQFKHNDTVAQAMEAADHRLYDEKKAKKSARV